MEKHFFDMEVNAISTDKLKEIEGEKQTILFKNGIPLPEGDNIRLFQGVMSQNFKKGEVSRNRYKYKQDGWFLDNYARQPLILWQHEADYGGIGFAQELYIDSKGNLGGIFYIDLDVLEDRNRIQVERGYVRAISTGANTLEDGFEEKETGKILTAEEAEEKYGFMEVINTLWGSLKTSLNYIILKQELVENSLVTIGSNYGALARKVNTLDDELKRRGDALFKQYSEKENPLLTNDHSMIKRNDTADTQDTPTVDDTQAAAGTQDGSAQAASADDAGKGADAGQNDVGNVDTGKDPKDTTGDDEAEALKADVESLKNSLKSLEDAFAIYGDEMEKKIDSLGKGLKINSRESARKNVFTVAAVPNKNGVGTEKQTFEEILRKHSQK